ncbi:MAG: HAD hydrolase-like protein [Phycisphaerae bacterium]|nr:HAD hydrolase-like protein [Phycisphaerae bacterium]
MGEPRVEWEPPFEGSATPLPLPGIVVFDLDGTLIDSAADLADAVNDVLARRRLQTWPVGAIRCWIGEGAERLMERALSGGNDANRPSSTETAAAVAEFRAVYAMRCTRHTTPYPGALEVLASLRSAGHLTAILTNKPANQTELILHSFGLDRLVDAWLGGDSAFGRKPDPRPLQMVVAHAVEKTGSRCRKGPEVWMIGDSVTDIRTAHAAGGTSIVVRGGYDDADPIDRCQPRPHRIIDSIREVLRLVPTGIAE